MRRKVFVSFLLALALCLSPAPGALAAENGPQADAAGAVVLDYDTGEFYYEKNADIPRPAASMTKVMSVYLVFEEIAAGRLSPGSYVTASANAAAISNDPLYSGLERLREGESYQVDTLLRLTMTASCNGSVIALAEHIGGGSEAAFVERMNAKAREMGIDARFADCCGIVDEGNAVTPRAMALLAKRAIEDFPRILEYSSLASTYFEDRTYESTNLLLRDGTAAGVDGLKSGYTTKAGFCFTGTAERDGRRIIAVVLDSGDRMSECRKLLEYGFEVRAEKERAWSGEEQRDLRLTIAVSSDAVYASCPNTLTATVSGLSDGIRIPCAVRWTVNGAALEGRDAGVAESGRTAHTVSYRPPAGAERAKIRCVVTMPQGRTLESQVIMPVSDELLTFTGELGVARAEILPEESVTVPCRIACDQVEELTVAAGWYLDGAPVPGFQNSAFRIGPGRTSQFTVRGSGLSPGEHVLEFRCNTAGLPGIDQAALRCGIRVLGAAPGPAIEAAA